LRKRVGPFAFLLNRLPQLGSGFGRLIPPLHFIGCLCRQRRLDVDITPRCRKLLLQPFCPPAPLEGTSVAQPRCSR
jgi:hypothetical protein